MKKMLAYNLVFIIIFLIVLCVTFMAQDTVVGEGSYVVTGESYPTSIQTAGYNSKDSRLYVNFQLYTEKEVGPEEKAVFYYFVEVFDGHGNELGRAGDYSSPLSTTGEKGSQEVTVINLEIVLQELKKAFRVVVTVKEVIVSI
ncbi:MAG: hypothetical protein Q7I94_03405 [Candidatus Contubernalis sp.]|nr:hypothetical protein [Candidatus Contubernalis sp.]